MKAIRRRDVYPEQRPALERPRELEVRLEATETEDPKLREDIVDWLARLLDSPPAR